MAPVLVASVLLTACPSSDGPPGPIATTDAGPGVEGDAGPAPAPAADAGVDGWVPPDPPHPCEDGELGEGETDVDCGGAACGATCELGQRCWSGDDCSGGAVCIWDVEIPGARAPGACRARVADCTPDACGAGEFCASEEILLRQPDTGEQQRTRVWFCRPHYTLGQECNWYLDFDLETCAPGSTCGLSGPQDEFRCEATVGLGEICSADAPCGPDLVCRFSLDERALRCVPAAREGEACEIETDCAGGLYCDRWSQRCAPRAAPGEACHPGIQSCTHGHRCEVPAGWVCEQSALDCDRSERCCATETGTECRPAGQACEAPVGVCN